LPHGVYPDLEWKVTVFTFLRMNESRRAPSKLLVLAWAIALGIGALMVALLLKSRDATWNQAATSNENLLYTVG